MLQPKNKYQILKLTSLILQLLLAELQITPITSQLVFLQNTIEKELVKNGVPDNFIVKAKFDISISKQDRALKTISCEAILIDKDGKIYKSKVYKETTYDSDFLAFKPTIIERLKNIFTNK